ncbi:MAG: PAS domain S-box protein [Nitrosomonadales bacterium]|nr:PAS domain S-box protein [Nitrosomonadales bacterium]
MKKLLAFLNTALGVMLAVSLLIAAFELLIMWAIPYVLIPMNIQNVHWEIIDAALLTLLVAPALYFLVFRRILEDEERFRQTLATAPNAIVIVDGQGRITDWNLAAQQMFGYSHEEAVGQLMHHLLPPQRYRDDAVRGFAHFQESGEGPVVGKTTEIAALRRDGSEFPVELSISAVKLQGRWHAIGIIHDISERRQAEAAFQTLVASLAQNIGAEFFRETVRSLSAWLGAECVIAGELVDENRVRALAMQLDGQAVEHYEYALPGTPCNNVASKGYCEYPEGVCQLFPADKDLADMGAEAYVGTPVRNKNGKAIGVLCAISRRKLALPAKAREVMEMIAARAGMEIERKRMVDVLHRSEERFHHLFENMNSAVAVYQPDAACEVFTFKAANHALERIERVKREEVLGRSVEDVFPGVRAFGLLEVFRRVCRSGEAEHFPPAFYRDERISGWRDNYVYRLGSGEIVAVYDDVTERKEAEDELRLRAQLLNSTADSIFVHDFDGNFVYLNEAAWKTRGYTRDELMTINLHVLDVPEYGKLIEGRIRELMEKGFGAFESAHRRKDGSVMPIEVNVHIIESGGRKLVLSMVRDITERKEAEQKKLEAGIRIKDALENAIGAIAATLEQRDPYTAGHQRRVAQLAAAIAEEMGLAREVIEGIHFGGLIHDLGKISVPAEILGKPGRLSDIELGLIKVHAEAGYRIVKDIAFPWPVADMVRQHHERLDGSGYPQGLKGEQIVLEARIMAVADVVEAMSANRPYRPGFGMDAALEEITRARGTQLDPVAVDACLRLIREKGFVFTK